MADTIEQRDGASLLTLQKGMGEIIEERLSNGTLNQRDPDQPPDPIMRTEGLSAWYGNPRHPVFVDITLPIARHRITALIGPSGCGKTTLLRCLNRLHETSPKAGSAGEVLLEGENIYDPGRDVVNLRRRVGFVFQKPNPFPTMSILDNVNAGLSLVKRQSKGKKLEIAEKYLSLVGLWNEVKDKLHQSGVLLSGGQQQRLCIARAAAVEPEVLLLDEPCSALDPRSTSRIEELMSELKHRYTMIIVTHNMQQASHVSDYTVFLCSDREQEGSPGKIIEFGHTAQVLLRPRHPETEKYVTGRF